MYKRKIESKLAEWKNVIEAQKRIGHHAICNAN